MAEPVSLGIGAAISIFTKSAPHWLPPLEKTALNIGKQTWQKYRDKKKHIQHLEQVLKKASEQGITKFHTLDERDQYRDVLTILSEPGAHSDALRYEILRLFTLSDLPNLAELNEIYNRSLRIRSLAQPRPPAEINAAPYLASLFEALIGQLYSDPFFKDQMSDVLKAHAALITRQLLPEVVMTLHEIRDSVAPYYSDNQFAQDVHLYVTHIESIFHRLKISGIVPKDKITDPELNGIFVPIRFVLEDDTIPQEKRERSITALLEDYPYLVLLGGPGSGKSTVTRYLAWSHAFANLSNFAASNIPLLSGNPLPLRIELRRLTEDRRQHRDYDFLSYATEVLLGRDGIEINPQMFKSLLGQKKMLLLFDGLDEVATLDERRRLVEDIEHFAQRYPGNRIVVTSRPVGYDLARFSDQQFTRAKVEEFNDEQIWLFLENWYRHVLLLSPIPHSDQQELEILFNTLKDNLRLRKLAVNPLLLTVITALHRYERLPDKRVLIYDRCADLLLETWAKLKGTDARWRDMKMAKDDQSACVAYLGFILHERSQEKEKETSSVEDIASDVSARFMMQQIVRFLENRRLITETVEQHAEARRFLELIQVEAGLIVERGKDENGEDVYGFVHRTFQEYFAALDVYERFQQEVEIKIISDFLKEHFHDPHWREVILLLLGKLKLKPITSLLRQVIEGDIKSNRSQFTNVVQQDLFFICDCLAEEIAVESNLAVIVISSLSNVVKTSPFPSQREDALMRLGSLAQTKQYASLAQKTITELVMKESTLDIDTKIYGVVTLYQSFPQGSKEQRQSIQVLSDLSKRSDLTFEQQIQAVSAIFDFSISLLEDQQRVQMLFNLIESPNLSVEQQTEVIEVFHWYRLSPGEQREFKQMLLRLAQRTDLSVEQQVEIAKSLHNYYSPSGETERKADQILLHLAQRTDLSVEQQVEIAKSLFLNHHSSSEAFQQAIQMLLRLAQRTDLSVEQQVEVAEVLFKMSLSSTEEYKLAFQILLRLIHHSDLSHEHWIKVVQALSQNYLSSLEERRQVIQLFSHLAQRTDLSVEQQIEIAKALYQSSFPLSEEEQQADQILLHLAQRTDLAVEQQVEIAKSLHWFNHSSSEVFQQAIQILLHLAQRTDLSVEQQVEVAEVLYRFSFSSSEEEQQAIRMLLHLEEQPNLSIEQRVRIFKAISLCRLPPPEVEKAYQMLLRLAQRTDLSAKQHKQIADTFRAHYIFSVKYRQSFVQILVQPLRLLDLTIEQQVEVAKNPYRYRFSSSKERRQVVQILFQLARRSDLSIDQQIQILENLYQYSSRRSEEERQQQAVQMLLQLAHRSDLSIDQQVQAAEALYRCSPSSEEKERQQQAVQMLLQLARRSDLSIDQQVQAAEALYRCSPSASEEERQAAKLLLDLILNESFTIEQRLKAVGTVFGATKGNYSDKLQALPTLFTLLKEEAIRGFLEEHWQTVYNKKVDSYDINLILELAKNDILPTKFRNEMYELLRQLVPQFVGVDATQFE